MTSNNIRLYKLGTRFRKSWHYAKSFNDSYLMRKWLEKVKNPNRDIYGFYKADFRFAKDYNFSSFYFVLYQDKKNIVIKTFFNDVMYIYPFVMELLNNGRL